MMVATYGAIARTCDGTDTAIEPSTLPSCSDNPKSSAAATAPGGFHPSYSHTGSKIP